MSTPDTGMAERYQRARGLFEHGEYQAAAEELSALVDASALEPPLHGTTELRLLLARSYYHSAQLNRAERVTRASLVDAPPEAYANHHHGRTRPRHGPAEARSHRGRGSGSENRPAAPAIRQGGCGLPSQSSTFLGES